MMQQDTRMISAVAETRKPVPFDTDLLDKLMDDAGIDFILPEWPLQNDIEARRKSITGIGHLHDKLAAEQAVCAVSSLVGKIELRGQQPAFARRLDFDVVVPRAAGIKAWHDRAEQEASFIIGENMPSEPKTRLVIISIAVGVPKVDEGAWDRSASARQNVAGQVDRPARDTRLAEIAALR
jgi:hypothetical protein